MLSFPSPKFNHKLNMKTGTKLTAIGLQLMVMAAMTLPGLTLAAPVGLKLGLNGNGNFQNTTSGSLSNLDLAGATLPNGGYAAAQTNWNNLGRWGGNNTPFDANRANTVLTIT